MAGEGEFPKVDGDILYSSEANLFNPKIIGNVIQNVNSNVSGPSPIYTTIGGSILYPGAGSQQINKFMSIQANCSSLSYTNVDYAFRIRCSGADTLNIILDTKTNTGALGAPQYLGFNYFLTSGIITASGGDITSPYVFFIEAYSNQDSPRAHVGDFSIMGF